jgi:hypothetical protein
VNPGLARLLRYLDELRRDVDQLQRDVIAESRMNDQLAEIFELRIVALEELWYARWPRSIGVRRRLRRDLREGVKPYRWMGPRFTARRFESIGDGWLGEPLSATGRHRNRGVNP